MPSVQRLEVPVILLCSSQSAGYVSEKVRDLPWASIEIQDDWYGGWRGAPEQIVTRLDSDDALRQDWFQILDRVSEASADANVYCTRDFLRLDARSGRLYSYRRREPSPLAAFRRGLNPYAHDHKHLEKHCKVRFLRGQYLLQIAHGNNLSNRLPAWWRIDRRVPRSRLAAFGLQSHASS